MALPALLADERCEIEEWLRSNGTSPKTGAELPCKNIYPNHMVRGMIKAFLQNQRNVGAGAGKAM